MADVNDAESTASFPSIMLAGVVPFEPGNDAAALLAMTIAALDEQAIPREIAAMKMELCFMSRVDESRVNGLEAPRLTLREREVVTKGNRRRLPNLTNFLKKHSI